MLKLKKFLEDSDLTQAEFAMSIGVKQPTVSDWLNGNMRPSIDNLIVIARKTGISIDELVKDFNSAVA